MSPAVLTLIILVVTAVAFITEILPVPLVAMLCAMVLVLTGIVPAGEVIAGFGNNTVIILISMLIVGGALFETGVTEKIARKSLKIAKTERQMIMVIFGVGTILSALLNNTGVMAMMIPLIVGIASSVGYSPSKMMMAGFLGVMCGGRLTLIGDATVNTIAMNEIQKVGGTFGFLDIGKIGLPLTIITAIWLYFIGYKTIPERQPSEETAAYANPEKKDVPRWKAIASVVIIAFVFFGMAFQKQFESLLGIPMPLYFVAMLGAVMVCALRILKGKQVYSLIDLKTVFLYVGMLPLGTALSSTGAAQMIADGVAVILQGSGNVYLITAIVFIVCCVMTQFTSNVVTINLIAPIAVAIANTLNVSPVALIVTTCIASTHSYATPIACPPATIIYGNGGFKFKDYAISNWSILLISFVVCVVLLPIIWPL